MKNESPIHRTGATNLLVLLACVSILLLATLFAVLHWVSRVPASSVASDKELIEMPLTIFCAAGLRYPVDQIANDYTSPYGTPSSNQ